MRKVVLIATCALALLFTSTVTFSAPFLAARPSPFKSLSVDHTHYGVSQFTAGTLNNKSYPIHVFNPTPATQIVGILFYSRPKLNGDNVPPGGSNPIGGSSWDPDIEPEEYLGCMVLRVTPHGAYQVEDDFFDRDVDISVLTDGASEVLWVNGGVNITEDNEDEIQGVFEAISVPEQNQRIGNGFGRIGDGLGVDVRSAIEAESLLIHPSVFTFPEAPAQRMEAAQCLCDGGASIGDRNLWSVFGLYCF